jgi:hypothetical protein
MKSITKLILLLALISYALTEPTIFKDIGGRDVVFDKDTAGRLTRSNVYTTWGWRSGSGLLNIYDIKQATSVSFGQFKEMEALKAALGKAGFPQQSQDVFLWELKS